jgi:putative transposase
MTIPQAARELEITEQTYCRWGKQYEGLKLDQAKRLKKLVADAMPDIAILREAAQDADGGR